MSEVRIISHPQAASHAEDPIISVMTVDPVSVRPKTTVAEAVLILNKDRIRHLPVVDEEQKVIGIISSTDVRHLAEGPLSRCHDNSPCSCGKACASRLTAAVAEIDPNILVESLMTANPVSLSPDDTLGLAADLFLSRAFHAAPIVEDGVLVGIVTDHDLLRAAYGNRE